MNATASQASKRLEFLISVKTSTSVIVLEFALEVNVSMTKDRFTANASKDMNTTNKEGGASTDGKDFVSWLFTKEFVKGQPPQIALLQRRIAAVEEVLVGDQAANYALAGVQENTPNYVHTEKDMAHKVEISMNVSSSQVFA